MTLCEGDGVIGFNTEATCYRLDACSGCTKCWIKHPEGEKCSQCPTWEGTKARNPEPGDYVVVHQPILDLTFKGKFTSAMEMAIGRVAWVKNGNPVDGFVLRFSTTEKDILDQFKYPLASLRLAMPSDNAIDKMIKVTKGTGTNESM